MTYHREGKFLKRKLNLLQKKHNIEFFFETSAKTGSNISESIDACVAIIEKNVDDGAYEITPAGDSIDFPQEQSDSGCKC